MGRKTNAQHQEELRRLREEQRLEAEAKAKRQNKLMWQIVICVAAIIVLIAGVALAMAISNKETPNYTTNDPLEMADIDTSTITDNDFETRVTDTDEVTNYVRLNITYTGNDNALHTEDIVIRLFPDVAPETVANFKNLVSEGFYDGLTFHRIIDGFMIQGGDPEGTGYGGSDNTIKGEFTNNGFTNNLEHIKGVVSMARSGSTENPSAYYNTASSQFFIVHENSPHLNGDYAAFGFVMYGIQVVDSIAIIETDASDKPINPVTINYATFVNVAPLEYQ